MPNAPKTPARTIRVDDATWAELQILAAKVGLTTSDVVRLALTDFLRANR